MLQAQLAEEGVVQQLVDAEHGTERADHRGDEQQRHALADQRAVDHPLRYEAVHRRQAGQADDADQHGQEGQRHACDQAAEAVQICSAGAVDHREDSEQQDRPDSSRN